MSHAINLYNRQCLREIEAAAASASGDSFALMQRAGLAAWHYLLANWPQAQRVVVACGPGNNGGDGYVLATHALQSGRQVSLVQLGEPRGKLALRACAGYQSAGGVVTRSLDAIVHAELVVDAVFGIGLTRAPDSAASMFIEAINASPSAVFSIDVPSGVDADTGNVPGLAVRAAHTLQLIAPHCGLQTGAAIDFCGRLDVDSLDVTLEDVSPTARSVGADALVDWLRPRQRNTHKGANGHVLCIGGDSGSGGAILLCADAALRSGAGLVSVATRAAHITALLARRPEVMAVGVEDVDALDTLIDRADIVAIGPGLGQVAWGVGMFDAAMAGRRSLVIDADGLNLLAQYPRALPEDTILTPHPGEAGRLLGIATSDVQADRFSAADALVERYKCVVVLKGAGTIVAAPNHAPFVIAAGNPGMAVGGMGDLLTGVIAALRAQGLDAFNAACCGALLHAAAGDAAARDGGERGLLPSDLLTHLRRLSNPLPSGAVS
ncbi:MAG: NAD(P)H-hydrate dehydratase [Luteimonas sp.]